jgi:hypothetical protein
MVGFAVDKVLRKEAIADGADGRRLDLFEDRLCRVDEVETRRDDCFGAPLRTAG